MRTYSLSVLALVAAFAAGPAVAQDRDFNFALRGGVAAVPTYPGADDYEAVPDVGFTFGALNWGNVQIGNGIGNQPDNGLALRGAFRVVGDRDPDDAPELAGLNKVDTAVELGFGLVYRQENWQAFGEVRHGFGGHHGVTGTMGADLIFRPTDRWTITAGPRLNLGNSEYANTYFGVTPGEAAASNFGSFDADGGLLGAGVAVGATYQIDDRWALEGLLSYERLQNDAADSPITQGGSEDQWSVRFGLSRAFNLRF